MWSNFGPTGRTDAISTLSIIKYYAPFNFSGQRRTTLTIVYTYNISTKLIYRYMKWKNFARRIQRYHLHIPNPRLIFWDGGSTILEDIEELNFQLSHVSRDANVAAHLCAQQANVSRRQCISINYVPSWSLANWLSSHHMNLCND